ncbi:MAG TPA: hypothetical protein VNB06_22410 [Thermoanaerobaculia bacterium]|nr:hypothetical protein [Thermoanaerobaculia bacterium]
MLALSLEAERRADLDAHTELLDATGHRLVVGIRLVSQVKRPSRRLRASHAACNPLCANK